MEARLGEKFAKLIQRTGRATQSVPFRGQDVSGACGKKLNDGSTGAGRFNSGARSATQNAIGRGDKIGQSFAPSRYSNSDPGMTAADTLENRVVRYPRMRPHHEHGIF